MHSRRILCSSKERHISTNWKSECHLMRPQILETQYCPFCTEACTGWNKIRSQFGQAFPTDAINNLGGSLIKSSCYCCQILQKLLRCWFITIHNVGYSFQKNDRNFQQICHISYGCSLKPKKERNPCPNNKNQSYNEYPVQLQFSNITVTTWICFIIIRKVNLEI